MPCLIEEMRNLSFRFNLINYKTAQVHNDNDTNDVGCFSICHSHSTAVFVYCVRPASKTFNASLALSRLEGVESP